MNYIVSTDFNRFPGVGFYFILFLGGGWVLGKNLKSASLCLLQKFTPGS